LRRDFYVGEAVILVNGLQGAYVGGDQGLAVCAVPVERIGGMNAQALHECRRVEVVISGNEHMLHAPPRPQLHRKEDAYLLVTGGLLLVGNLDVEITLPLIVVAEAAAALVEQVLVDCALLIDGNNVLDALRGNFGALDQHLDDWAAGS
jgi:hypothetical protein